VTGQTAGDVRIETPQGFAVGDSIAELTASVPEAPALQFETGGALVNFDVVTGTAPGSSAGSARRSTSDSTADGRTPSRNLSDARRR
jgi:hypothetical protein